MHLYYKQMHLLQSMYIPLINSLPSVTTYDDKDIGQTMTPIRDCGLMVPTHYSTNVDLRLLQSIQCDFIENAQCMLAKIIIYSQILKKINASQ